MKFLYRAGLCVGLWAGLMGAGVAQERLVEGYLEKGDIAGGRAAVESALKAAPGKDELILQLAITQFLGSVETFSQSMYSYGLDPSTFGDLLPFLRFPVAVNPDPKAVTNDDVRRVLSEFVSGLGETSKTLALIKDSSSVKVPVRLGMIRLDLDGDGVARPKETLWSIYSELNPGSGWTEERARKLGARFDAADARWLEGYCHVLSAMAQTGLAYDTQKLFDHTAHLFFAKATLPFDFLKPSKEVFGWKLVDAVAFLHLIDLPVKDAELSRLALAHMQQVTALSRRSWACILAETDDDYEWIPSPKQHGVLPQSPVTEEMVASWHEFLDEADALLAGSKLLPFWRGPEAEAALAASIDGEPSKASEGPGRGVNLRRVYNEPSTLDLVLWVQGTAAVPYLEEGQVTSPDFWRRLDRAFRGNFLGYAVWLN